MFPGRVTPCCEGQTYKTGANVAKGQKKSNREAKKPKKTDAERAKASSATETSAMTRYVDKNNTAKK